jgi:hypothetical protein
MRQRLRSHLTYANVMATIAVFMVLGGTTYAATGGKFILGESNTASTATQLSSGAGSALKLTNTAGGNGVLASGGTTANNTAAVNGSSSAGNGVQGISGKHTASGVYGQNNSTGFGVAGRSTNGTGVMGDSSGGWAIRAFGNAKQTRAGNGFVKAMAYVDPINQPSDPIQQCFNSQRAPNLATSGNCGITYTKSDKGNYTLDFGFSVNDRFISVTDSEFGDSIVSAHTATLPSNTVNIIAFRPATGLRDDDAFYVFVY